VRIAEYFGVSADSFLGKTDKKEKPTIVSDDGLSDSQRLLISQLRSMSPEEFEKKEAAIRAILDL
jgi:hypothetical protein